MCCVALPCCLFDLACFFLPSFSSLIKTCITSHNYIHNHYSYIPAHTHTHTHTLTHSHSHTLTVHPHWSARGWAALWRIFWCLLSSSSYQTNWETLSEQDMVNKMTEPGKCSVSSLYQCTCLYLCQCRHMYSAYYT